MKTLAAFTFILLPFFSSSTHITGGEIFYDHIGGTTYLIRLDFYFDCSSVVNMQNTVNINCTSQNCGSQINLLLNLESGFPQQVPMTCSTVPTTCNGGTFPGILHYRYSAIVDLFCSASDWNFSYNQCCRNSSITNLNNPDVQSIILESSLDNVSVPNNFSSRALAFPFFLVCQGSLSHLNAGAFDPDGDSLVYSFVQPRQSSTTTVNYNAGYNVSAPFGIGQTATINSQTGDVTILCTNQEVVALGIEIKEYRNGVHIASVFRDIQVTVLPCGANTNPSISGFGGLPYSALTSDTTIIAGDTIDLSVFGMDADIGDVLEMSWNGFPWSTAASFNITGNNTTNPVGRFNWPTTCNDASSSPYCFVVNLKDDFCPIEGTERRTYCVKVETAPDIQYSHINSMCIEDTLLQLAPNYSGGQWHASCGICIDSSGFFNANIAGAGQHILTYQMTSSCTTYFDTSTVEVVDIVVDTIISDWHSCLDSCSGVLKVSAHSTDTQNLNYHWSNGTTNSINDSLCEGLYHLLITNGLGCSFYDSLEISPPDSILIHAEHDQYFCEPAQTRTSIVIDKDNGDPLYYYWNDSLGALTNFFEFQNDTIFEVYVVDQKSCTSNVDTVSIFVNNPQANFYIQNTEVPTYNDLIYISNENNNGLVNWSWSMIMENGVQQISSDSNLVLDLTTLGINRNIGLEQEKEIHLIVVDFAGCVNDTTISIKYLDQDELFMPNAFSPDADGLNDSYGPVSKYEMSSYTFFIYNRWGDLLFRSNDISDKWDGRFQGEKMKQGNYLWKLEYTMLNKDEPKTRIGDVRLLRKR